MGFSYVNSPPINSLENCKPVLELYSRDSSSMNPVYYCIDSLGGNFFYSDLKSTVCNDTLCRPIHLKVFWDLAGNYTKFDTISGSPLTKNDHLEFKSDDYQKLNQTLKDEYSILANKTSEELVDKSNTRYSDKIDGYTGATVQEVKSAVVEGALFSTYTIWHMVHGDIKTKIRSFSKKHFDDHIELQLLQSKNPKTVIFALKNMDSKKYLEQFEMIIGIMESGNFLVNFYLAKNIPLEVFNVESNKNELLRIWDKLDPNTKSILSKYL